MICNLLSNHRGDDKGEVDYELEGTGIKFRIWAYENLGERIRAKIEGGGIKTREIDLIWKEDKFLYLFIGGNKDNLEFKKVY